MLSSLSRGSSTSWLSLVAALSLYFCLAWGNLWEQSLTWDEPAFIGSGFQYLAAGEFQLNPSHPPLMQSFAALPLHLMGVHPPERERAWRHAANPAQAVGQQLLFYRGNDPRLLAWWARLPSLLSGAGTIVVVFLWTFEVWGFRSALATALLVASSPNLIAHAQLATEEAGCTFFVTLTCWLYWQCFSRGRSHWGLAGLALGCALASKYTSLFLLPLQVLFLALSFKRRRDAGDRLWAGNLKVLVVAGFVVGATYNFTFDYLAYMRGVSLIYSDTVPDFQFYLLGSVSKTSFWHYYLVAYVLKTPISVHALMLIGFWTFWRREGSSGVALYAGVPVLFLLLITCFDSRNLGLRRILPVLPLTLVLLGNCWKRPLAWVLLLGALAESLWVYPHFLSYFNLMSGGATAGHRYLDDSNIDWGQDLPALARWQASHPEAGVLKVAYFGTSPPEAYGVRSVAVTPSDLVQPLPGVYAVSVHLLIYLKKQRIIQGTDCDWLSKYRPIGRAGYSIYLYQFN